MEKLCVFIVGIYQMFRCVVPICNQFNISEHYMFVRNQLSAAVVLFEWLCVFIMLIQSQVSICMEPRYNQRITLLYVCS